MFSDITNSSRFELRQFNTACW